MSPSCSVMSARPSSSSLRLTVSALGLSPGFEGVTDLDVVAGVLRRRAGNRQRLEERHGRACHRDVAGYPDFTADLKDAPRLELIHLDPHLRIAQIAFLQHLRDLDLRFRQRETRDRYAIEYGIVTVPSVSTRYLFVRPASSVTMIGSDPADR